VTRNRSRRRRASANRADYALRLILLGIAVLVVPALLRSSPIGKALSGLWPFGLLMVAVGGAFLPWARRDAAAGSDKSAKVAEVPRVRTRGRGATRSDSRSPDEDAAGRMSPVTGPAATALATAAAAPMQLQYETWRAEVFRDMVDWRRFEAVVEKLFAQAGFETRSQSHGADGGVDIWLHSRNQPGAPVSVVQCKHWSGRLVGVDKVRELRGVMAAHDVVRGQFATTSAFSEDAVTFARANGINLLDVDGLLALIGTRTQEQQHELLAVAYAGEHWRPTCVNCGVKLVERRPRSGGTPFWGCSNYPRCKTTMQMRSG
jgi:restriction system protein